MVKSKSRIPTVEDRKRRTIKLVPEWVLSCGTPDGLPSCLRDQCSILDESPESTRHRPREAITGEKLEWYVNGVLEIMKIFLIVVLSIFGTMEACFCCKVIRILFITKHTYKCIANAQKLNLIELR